MSQRANPGLENPDTSNPKKELKLFNSVNFQMLQMLLELFDSSFGTATKFDGHIEIMSIIMRDHQLTDIIGHKVNLTAEIDSGTDIASHSNLLGSSWFPQA